MAGVRTSIVLPAQIQKTINSKPYNTPALAALGGAGMSKKAKKGSVPAQTISPAVIAQMSVINAQNKCGRRR